MIAIRQPPLFAGGEIARGTIFSAPMTRAILNTQPNVWPARAIDPNLPFKFQTRRKVAPQPHSQWSIPPAKYFEGYLNRWGCEIDEESIRCPHPVGTELRVKETYLRNGDSVMYSDDDDWDICYPERGEKKSGLKWEVVSAIYMPRWASRIDLLVKSVRVERVQDISEADAVAEGFKDRAGFIDLFSGHNPGAWEKNIWVWVYTFGRVK
jgi:hypothetical protein